MTEETKSVEQLLLEAGDNYTQVYNAIVAMPLKDN
jgi:hypothetical protein